MTLPAILHAAILHAEMLTLVFRDNFLIKLTLASKKEETKKQACFIGLQKLSVLTVIFTYFCIVLNLCIDFDL